MAGAGAGSPLVSVELRKLGGALLQGETEVQLIDNRAGFSINALGLTHTPEVAANVQSHLSLLSEAMKPYSTGAVFLNFMEVDPAEDRVRAAYTSKDWEKLTSLKKKYDQNNIFRFNRNIPPHV